MAKPKILELDLARAFAILAVLMIHGTSEASYYLTVGSRSRVIYLWLNKMSNFAVPVFILLSGIVLFYRYADSWNGKEALSFYRKRLQFIVIPYLLWSLFYEVFGPWSEHFRWSDVHFQFSDFLGKLQWADTPGYHLYYIVIIVQLYVLFPFLMSLVRLWPWFGRNLAWIGILVQVGFYLYHARIHAFEHTSMLWFTYIGLFCIGGAIGLHYEKIREWEHHLWWVFGVSLLLGNFLFVYYLLGDFHVDFPIPAFDLAFNLYAVGACFSILWIGRKILTGAPRLAKWLSSLGAVSFGVYLIHPAVLTLLRNHWIYPVESLKYHLATGMEVLLALVVPWVIVAILKRWKGSWILLGK